MRVVYYGDLTRPIIQLAPALDKDSIQCFIIGLINPFNVLTRHYVTYLYVIRWKCFALEMMFFVITRIFCARCYKNIQFLREYQTIVNRKKRKSKEKSMCIDPNISHRTVVCRRDTRYTIYAKRVDRRGFPRRLTPTWHFFRIRARAQVFSSRRRSCYARDVARDGLRKAISLGRRRNP